MATPTYKGSGQPTVNGGWLGGLGSWFGVKAPSYAGSGQAASGSTGYLSGATPTYKSGSTSQDVRSSSEPERITFVVPRGLIEPQQ